MPTTLNIFDLHVDIGRISVCFFIFPEPVAEKKHSVVQLCQPADTLCYENVTFIGINVAVSSNDTSFIAIGEISLQQ